MQIYDYITLGVLAYIVYDDGGYEAEITNIASSNGYIYVLRKYAKTIDAYHLASTQFSS